MSNSYAAAQQVNAIFSSLRKPRQEYSEVPQPPLLWPKSCPSQDVKPSLPPITESRRETQLNHIGWETH